MRDVYLSGVGMTHFGKFGDRSLKDLGHEAVGAALRDGGTVIGDVEAAYVANSMAGVITGQEAIRGQVVLHGMGIGDIPVFNVENACASSSSALSLAWQAVGSGVHDTVLVLGVEKLFHLDRAVSYRALGSAVDVEIHPPDGTGSPFLAHAAARADKYLADLGADVSLLAKIAVKTHDHGAHNPFAQYQQRYTEEEILASPQAVGCFTRLMCAPIGDGAAAIIVTAAEGAVRRGGPRIRIIGTAVGSARAAGGAEATRPMATRISERAYEQAGLGPEDIDVVELHDTTTFNELVLYGELGLFAAENLVQAVDGGWTRIGGRLPINPSGGLISRGHPPGATGAAQIVELVWQLRGDAGARQVAGARIALAQNGGGHVGGETAAMVVTILARDAS